jgi:SRSO17 transposase
MNSIFRKIELYWTIFLVKFFLLVESITKKFSKNEHKNEGEVYKASPEIFLMMLKNAKAAGRPIQIIKIKKEV